MASIICPKCGVSNESRGIFCGNCGYALQADGSATSSPAQGQPGGAYSSPAYPAAGSPPPPPPTYSTNMMPSSPAYPAPGAPPPPPSSYPNGNMPSSPIYPAGGSPPPPSYPNSNMPPSPVYLAGGSPPISPSSPTYSTNAVPPTSIYPVGGSPLPPSSSPSYPTNVMPSSPMYPAGGSQFPPGGQPGNEPNVPPAPRRRGKKGIIAILAIVVIVILAGAVGIFEYNLHKSASTTSTSTSTPGTTATAVPTAGPATPTPDVNATSTAVALTGSSTSTPGTTATPGTNATATTGPSGSNYSATQPGPGCDSNGGTWTPQGISNITCGTTISTSSGNARGYLYLQLPNNAAFSPNNSIGVSAGLRGSTDCVGLAEQDANTGFLAEYCDSGNWYIYSITSGGATVKTLDQSITSTRSTEQLLLTLKGTTLTFTIDSEAHTINVSPIHPIKVAITFITASGYGGSVPITNFSYLAQ